MNFKKLFVLILAFGILGITQSYSQLIISQYTETETGSFPKGIELWNTSGATIDFSATKLEIKQGTNGSTTLTTLVTLSTGTLGAGEVYIFGTNEIKTYMDLNGINAKFLFHNSQFNGNDALQISLGGVVTDIFGAIGVNPGTEWVGSGISTANQDIELKDGITSGSSVNWTDPSLRFQYVGPGTDLTGFGVAPGKLAPEPTFEVLHKENFATFTLGQWTGYSVTSNKNWFASSFANKTFASMNGFGADVVSNDWLISPSFDLSIYRNIKFSFSYQKRNTGPNLDIKISNNYVPGTDPTLATWTTLGTVSAAGWAYQAYDISAYDNKDSYIAFHYTSTGVISATAAEWNLDDMLVTGDLKFGILAEQLTIAKSNPTTPLQNVPFELVIRAVDKNGLPTPLATDTKIELKKIVGTGVLTGNMTATLMAGNTKISFPNLMYTGADRLRIKVSSPDNKPGPQYLADYEQDFMVQSKPTIKANVYQYAHLNAIHPITAIATNSVGNANTNFNGYDVTLSITPATFTGTIKKKIINGIVNFGDIKFTALGTYTVNVTTPYLGTSVNYTVNVIAQPTMTEVIVPKVIKGDGAFIENGGTGRMPSLALVKFSGLHPNQEYRYNTGITRTIPNNMSNPAGRNMVKKYNQTGWSFLSSGKSLTNPDEYSSFLADGSGNALVWVNVVPDATTDAASGYSVYWLVELGTGAGNTLGRFYTTSTSNTVQIGYGTTQASGIYESRSVLTPKNIVALYDQNNAVITTAIVQDDGATLQTPGFAHQSPWFYADYENVSGAWATVIPNNLPGGVRKVAELNMQGIEVKSFTDDDGIWADYNTNGSNYAMNPPAVALGTVYFATPYLNILNPEAGTKICNDENNFDLTFDARGISKVNIWIAKGTGAYELLAANVDARNNKYMWNILRSNYRNTNLKLKIESVEHTYANDEVINFNVFDTPEILGISSSKVMCLGSKASLQVEADGSNLKYQWFKDGEKMTDGNGVIGTNTELLRFDKVTLAHSGSYYAIVNGENVCTSVQTPNMTLYIATTTKVVSPTKDTDIGYKDGEKVFLNFQLHVGGQIADDVTLQNYNVKVNWYKIQNPGLPDLLIENNDKYAGAHSNILSIKNITPVDAGIYFAKIWTVCGDSTITLKYNLKEVKLDVAEEPGDATVCQSKDLTIKADFVSSIVSDIVYQWKKDGIALANDNHYLGVFTKELTIVNALPTQTGIYTLVAYLKNYPEMTKSITSDVTVKPLPVIEVQPLASTNVQVSKALTLNVVAKGGTITYQWKKDGVDIASATTDTYTKNSVLAEDAGVYTCVVTNECGSVVSTNATVVVSTGAVSDVREVENNGWILRSPSPNPVNSNSVLQLFAKSNSNVEIRIYDASGFEVYSSDFQTEAGWNNLSINTNLLSNGTYFYSVNTGSIRLVQSFIVIK